MLNIFKNNPKKQEKTEIKQTQEIDKTKIIDNEMNQDKLTKEKKKSFLSRVFKSKQIKKVETQKIKNYKAAIKTIEIFISTYEFAKAEKALNEISIKEETSYRDLMDNIEQTDENELITKEKEKIKDKYKKKQKEIEKLIEECKEEKQKYETEIEKQRFDIRFKNIKKETNHLAKTWKASSAIKLLQNFLKENPWNKFVIDFYNKEKKIILKQIEKDREKEEEKLKQNAKIEALKLIWEEVSKTLEEEKKKKAQEKSFFDKIKEKFSFYKKIKQNIERKKLIDEINLLLEEEDKVKNDIASAKLENIHKWLIKDISRENLIWYDLYGKTLWAHKISGDTFWFSETKEKYTFFIWDATWHWVKAWFVITLLTRLFNQLAEKVDIKKLIYEINNWLKQDLKTMNFITWIFFEIFKQETNKLKFVWLWHEPILIYRSDKKEIERVIPWWLAAWIRIIKEEKNIKVNEIEMLADDILLTYSDWIAESKSLEWEFYWIDRLEETLKTVATLEKDIKKIYEYIIKDTTNFRWWASFDDDLTILLLKRNPNKDKIKSKEEFLEEIWEIKSITKKDIRKLKWETKEEIKEELKVIKQENQLKSIVKQLEQLWLTWEILKLKSEAKRYIKQWYVHPKINYYLKKAIENTQKYKISLKEERIKSKFNLMKELMKKWDYDTVIKEAENIISKDWNL